MQMLLAWPVAFWTSGWKSKGDAVGCRCLQALPICRGARHRDGAGAGDGHGGVTLAQVPQQGSCLSAKALHLLRHINSVRKKCSHQPFSIRLPSALSAKRGMVPVALPKPKFGA